jgi:hypothetical protein
MIMTLWACGKSGSSGDHCVPFRVRFPLSWRIASGFCWDSLSIVMDLTLLMLQ